jgi:Trypsin
VIQRRLVLTAGHCVYNAEQGYWYTDFRFVPAYDEGVAPFETWDFEQAFTTQSWLQSDGVTWPNAADFAILVMTDKLVEGEARAIGELLGWLGWQTDIVANSHVTILGYPINLDNGERMQQTNSQTFQPIEDPAPGAVFGSAHRHGASGGPFILNFGEAAEGQDEPMANVVVGIASYAHFDPSTGQPLNDAACQATRGNCI